MKTSLIFLCYVEPIVTFKREVKMVISFPLWPLTFFFMFYFSISKEKSIKLYRNILVNKHSSILSVLQPMVWTWSVFVSVLFFLFRVKFTHLKKNQEIILSDPKTLSYLSIFLVYLLQTNLPDFVKLHVLFEFIYVFILYITLYFFHNI